MPAPKKVTIEIPFAVEVDTHVYECYRDPDGGPTITITTADGLVTADDGVPEVPQGFSAFRKLPELRVMVGGRANEIPLTTREGDLFFTREGEAVRYEGGAV